MKFLKSLFGKSEEPKPKGPVILAQHAEIPVSEKKPAPKPEPEAAPAAELTVDDDMGDAINPYDTGAWRAQGHPMSEHGISSMDIAEANKGSDMIQDDAEYNPYDTSSMRPRGWNKK